MSEVPIPDSCSATRHAHIHIVSAGASRNGHRRRLLPAGHRWLRERLKATAEEFAIL
jgi:hypothetical protein